MSRHSPPEPSTLTIAAELAGLLVDLTLVTVGDWGRRQLPRLPGLVLYPVTLAVSVTYGRSERTERNGGAE